MKKSPVLAAVLFLALPVYVHAAETAVVPVAEEKPVPALDRYLEKVDHKFDKAAVDFTAGWTEVVSEPVRQARAGEGRGKIWGGLRGFGQGLVEAPLVTTGGLLNALTAFFPGAEIPLPGNGVDVKSLTGGEFVYEVPRLAPESVFSSSSL